MSLRDISKLVGAKIRVTPGYSDALTLSVSIDALDTLREISNAGETVTAGFGPLIVTLLESEWGLDSDRATVRLSIHGAYR